jgi:hypothetical protein
MSEEFKQKIIKNNFPEVEYPKIYEPLKLNCSRGKEITIAYSPNCILTKPKDEEALRSILEKQNLQHLLNSDKKTYYEGNYRYDLSDASDSDLTALRNLDLTAPTSKLPNPGDDVFEKYKKGKDTSAVIEDCRCRLPKKIREKVKSLRERKRYWKKLYNGDYKKKKK